MSAYFSLGATGGSRKIQSQEPIKSTGEKLVACVADALNLLYIASAN